MHIQYMLFCIKLHMLLPVPYLIILVSTNEIA